MRRQAPVVLAFACVCCLTGAAQEFGWRVGATAWSFRLYTLSEAIDKTAACGMSYIEPFQGQKVFPDSDATLDVNLPDETIQQIRDKLAAAKVTMTSMYIHTVPGEEEACRQVFEFAKKLGLQCIVSEPAPEALDVIERLCNEYGISLALHNHPEGKSRYWHPDEVLKACEGRGPRIGACGDTGHWLRSNLDPSECTRKLGDRLLTLHLKDLNAESVDMPWGQGRGNIEQVLRTVHELRLKPALFGIEYETAWEDNMPQVTECARWFHETVAKMAAEVNLPGELRVGWASADITPPQPVALVGQLSKRISQSVLDPLTVTALALETVAADGKTEQAVLLSCDLVGIFKVGADGIREAVKARVPQLDPRKILINATHTHTAPGLADSTFLGLYDVSNDPGVMTADAYCEFFVERAADAVVRAWESRAPGAMSWALGHAAIGINRRTLYADGTAKMYGTSDTDAFLAYEGATDTAVDTLLFWNADGACTGMVINIACPSQETEGLSDVSADFWHDVRVELRKRHGDGLFILPQCSAAGDISPHPMFRKPAELAMVERTGLTRRQVIANRIADAVDACLATAQEHAQTSLALRHLVLDIDLPEANLEAKPFYETDPVRPFQMNVLRIGDVAMASNPFELYLDYGLRIEGRSRAMLTMLVQLANSHSGYLPTARGVAGGGYSADKYVVGPEGGEALVEETLSAINALFP